MIVPRKQWSDKTSNQSDHVSYESHSVKYELRHQMTLNKPVSDLCLWYKITKGGKGYIMTSIEGWRVHGRVP